jgi:regulator of replication initiation timing
MSNLIKSNTLKDILDAFHTIENWISESGGELTPELEQLCNFNLEQLEQKVDGYQMVAERLELSIEFFDQKAKFYKKIADGFNTVRENIRTRIKFLMIENQMGELSGSEIRFKLSNTAPTVEITDEHSIPKEYIETVITTRIDKRKLRDALELGLDVEGAKLVTNKSLRTYAVKK